MRVVCVSDTHVNHQITVPEGDVLLHAGDLTTRGGLEEIAVVGAWLKTLPHKHKVLIAGNHDFIFQGGLRFALRHLPEDVVYLEDSEVEIEGIRIWGSPWQPWFNDWAFNLRRGEELARKWAMIPSGVDVLLTHTPPHGVLDSNAGGALLGCRELTRRLEILRPRAHVFGHIHESYGTLDRDGTLFINAALGDNPSGSLRKPIVFEIDAEGPARLLTTHAAENKSGD